VLTQRSRMEPCPSNANFRTAHIERERERENTPAKQHQGKA
jgi:hypothetical protein